MTKTLRGRDLVAALQRKLVPTIRKSTLKRKALANILGYSDFQIRHWEDRNAPVKGAQIANLVAKAARQAQRETIKPIIEFYDFVPDNERLIKSTQKTKKLKAYKLLDEASRYEKGIKEQLGSKHGVYIFYDSRGRALYVGKATHQTLLREMTNVINRPRAIQNIKKVRHPYRKVEFRKSEEKRRQIVPVNLKLHDLAFYMSAYEVPDHIINVFEAMLVRSFANDLLNVRMERFSQKAKSKKKSRKNQ